MDRGEVSNVRYGHHRKKASQLYGSIWGTAFFYYNIPLIFIVHGWLPDDLVRSLT